MSAARGLRIRRGRAGDRCPFCHDLLGAEACERCPRCAADHHRECWEEHGGCSACGAIEPMPWEWDESEDETPAERRIPVRVQGRGGALIIEWGDSPDTLQRCWVFRVLTALSLLALVAIGPRAQAPAWAGVAIGLAVLVALALKLAADARVDPRRSGRLVVDDQGLRRFGLPPFGLGLSWRLEDRWRWSALAGLDLDTLGASARLAAGPIEVARLPDATAARQILDQILAARPQSSGAEHPLEGRVVVRASPAAPGDGEDDLIEGAAKPR